MFCSSVLRLLLTALHFRKGDSRGLGLVHEHGQLVLVMFISLLLHDDKLNEQTTEKTIHTICLHGTSVVCSEVQRQRKSTIVLFAIPSLLPTVRWTSSSEQRGLRPRRENRIYSRSTTLLLPAFLLNAVHNKSRQIHKSTESTNDTNNQKKRGTVMTHFTVNSLTVGRANTGIGIWRAVASIQTPRRTLLDRFYSVTRTKGQPP